jgi:hypothetical protein
MSIRCLLDGVGSMVASEDRGRFEGLRKPAANIGGVADDWEQFLLGIST